MWSVLPYGQPFSKIEKIENAANDLMITLNTFRSEIPCRYQILSPALQIWVCFYPRTSIHCSIHCFYPRTSIRISIHWCDLNGGLKKIWGGKNIYKRSPLRQEFEERNNPSLKYTKLWPWSKRGANQKLMVKPKSKVWPRSLKRWAIKKHLLWLTLLRTGTQMKETRTQR